MKSLRQHQNKISYIMLYLIWFYSFLFFAFVHFEKCDILFLFEYEQTPFDFEVLCLYQLFQHRVEKPSIKYIAFSDDHNNDNDDGDEKFTLLE